MSRTYPRPGHRLPCGRCANVTYDGAEHLASLHGPGETSLGPNHPKGLSA
jgi:hypothetical protein